MKVAEVRGWRNPTRLPVDNSDIEGVELKYVCMDTGGHVLKTEIEIREEYIDEVGLMDNGLC